MVRLVVRRLCLRVVVRRLVLHHASRRETRRRLTPLSLARHAAFRRIARKIPRPVDLLATPSTVPPFQHHHGGNACGS